MAAHTDSIIDVLQWYIIPTKEAMHETIFKNT